VNSQLGKPDYAEFLASKRIAMETAGFEPSSPLNPALKPFQAECVHRALVRGRSALFASCGLGKSLIELEWATHVARRSDRPVILLTPLAVSRQFEREAVKFNIDGVKVCKDSSGVAGARIVVTNYERLHHFRPDAYGGIVLDESSILKAFDGSTRKAITAFAKAIPYRLAATATPAPNDQIELTNHAEFLDVLTGKEIIALFFTQDGNTTQKWRLKGHAVAAYWRWLASWVTALRTPSDLGFSDEGYILPPLDVTHHVCDSAPQPGLLFPVEARTLQERRGARRASLPDRVSIAADLATAETGEPWVCWCDLNAEAEALTRAIPGAVECRGSESPEEKEAKFDAFSAGNLRVLVTKPSIAGWGLNWQHCARTSFVGLSDSFEQQFQALRRLWRFGQSRPVAAHMIASEAEGAVSDNLRRKERQAAEMFDQLVKHMGSASGPTSRGVSPYEPTVEMVIPDWLRSEASA
jgi:hypothetical protein